MAYGIPEDKRKEIVAMYRDGKPLREIASRIGVSIATVMKYVALSGIGRRNRWISH
jgi:DNA-directed RNA polymerase specialized sigma24 family protein